MENRNSSFIYPNSRSLYLLSKTIDDLQINFSVTKNKVQLSDIFKYTTAIEKVVTKEDNLILYKTPLRLYNNGNNCYINSSMQALLPTINNELKLSLRNARKYNFPAIELFNLYLDRLENKFDCWSPTNHIKNLRYFSKNFRNGAQEDAQEFLNGFLDRLREEFDKIESFKGSNNPVRKTYAPFYDCRYFCCKCNKSNIKSPQIQEELTFFLELSQDLPGMINMALKTQNNNFKCDNCKTTNGSARMNAVFTSLPKSFICCLKRFKHNFFNGSKNGRDVEFCKYIDLPYIDENGNRAHAKYDIAAVVIHLGSSLSSGHYECISKLGGQWHRISDSSITKINEVQAMMSTRNSSYIYIFTHTTQYRPNPRPNPQMRSINDCHKRKSSFLQSHSDLKRRCPALKSHTNFPISNFYKKHNQTKRHKSKSGSSLVSPGNNSSMGSNGCLKLSPSNSGRQHGSAYSSNQSSFASVNSSPINRSSSAVVCQNS